MAITLIEAKKNVQDALQLGVIDEFAKSNFLLRNMIFDDAVSPTGGGATLTYGYTRLTTQGEAAFRKVNAEYSTHEVSKDRYTVDLKVFGGAYEIDRIIAGMGGIVSEVELQQAQKIKAATALWNDTVINGDSAVNEDAFDGLDKALTGSSTEFIVPTLDKGILDLSSAAKLTENAHGFVDVLDEFLMGLDGIPSFIGGNTKLIAKLRATARRIGAYQLTTDSWGHQIESYNNIPFVDFGAKSGSNQDVVETDASGETSLYAARLAIDGFHAVSMAGQPPIKAWLPDFTTAGAVKKGEVEMISAMALKKTKAAGVLRGIKVK